MTNKEYMEYYKSSKFARLNKKQREKVAPITTIIIRELNNLYLDEIEAIFESIERTLKESSQYHAVHVPHRDED